MTWARLDDQAWKNDRLLGLSKDARLLWVFGLSFVAEGWPRNDGDIGPSQAAALARMHGIKQSAIAELVELGRWEKTPGGGFHVHDVEHYMPPKDLSEKRSRAGKAGAAISNSNRPANAAANAEQSSGNDAAQGIPIPVPVPVSISPNGEIHRSEIAAVWEVWVGSTGRTSCKLDAKRKRVITARLKDYPLDDVLDAVRGWERDPWDGRRQQNEIAILLRDNAHLEKFRDLWRQPSLVATAVGAEGYTGPTELARKYW